MPKKDTIAKAIARTGELPKPRKSTKDSIVAAAVAFAHANAIHGALDAGLAVCLTAEQARNLADQYGAHTWETLAAAFDAGFRTARNGRIIILTRTTIWD